MRKALFLQSTTFHVPFFLEAVVPLSLGPSKKQLAEHHSNALLFPGTPLTVGRLRVTESLEFLVTESEGKARASRAWFTSISHHHLAYLGALK